MSPEDTLGNLGIALGLLHTTGSCSITVNGEDKVIYSETIHGDSPWITVEDVFWLLQAEEVR